MSFTLLLFGSLKVLEPDHVAIRTPRCLPSEIREKLLDALRKLFASRISASALQSKLPHSPFAMSWVQINVMPFAPATEHRCCKRHLEIEPPLHALRAFSPSLHVRDPDASCQPDTPPNLLAPSSTSTPMFNLSSGPANKNGRCAMCHGSFWDCPGHYG